MSVGPAGIELSTSRMTATGARLCWPGMWFCPKTKQNPLWVEYVFFRSCRYGKQWNLKKKEYGGCICHAILDLHTYGFFASPGVAKKWFESYLTGGEQWIMVKKHLSDYFQLNSEMPQGSCLNFYQFFSTWNPSIWPLSVFYVVSSISSPFRRLHQADHIAEGQTTTPGASCPTLWKERVGSFTSHRIVNIEEFIVFIREDL